MAKERKASWLFASRLTSRTCWVFCAPVSTASILPAPAPAPATNSSITQTDILSAAQQTILCHKILIGKVKNYYAEIFCFPYEPRTEKAGVAV